MERLEINLVYTKLLVWWLIGTGEGVLRLSQLLSIALEQHWVISVADSILTYLFSCI